MKKLVILFVILVSLIACALGAQAENTSPEYNIYGYFGIEGADMYTVALSQNAEGISEAVAANDVFYIGVYQKEYDGSFNVAFSTSALQTPHNVIINYDNRTYVRRITSSGDRYDVPLRDSVNLISINNGVIYISGYLSADADIELICGGEISASYAAQTGDLSTEFSIPSGCSECVIAVSSGDFKDSHSIAASEGAVYEFAQSDNAHLAHFNLPVVYSDLSGSTEQRYNQRVSELPDEVNVIAPVQDSNDNVYYVSPTGDDSNDGSIDSPLATIEKALQMLRQSQHSGSIILREGVYNTDSTIYMDDMINADGNCGVTFIKGYDEEEAVITSGVKLESDKFESAGLSDDRILVYDLKELGEQYYTDPRNIRLYMGAAELKKSRWPEDSEVMMGDIVYGGPNVDGQPVYEDPTVIYKSLYDEPFNWDLDKGVFFNGAIAATGRWDVTEIRVGTADSSTGEIKLNGYSWVGQAKGNNEDVTHYYDNVFEQIDVPGEYSIDIENGLLYLYDGSEISLDDITIACGECTLINVTGARNIVFDNLSFMYADKAIEIADSEDIIIQNCNFAGFVTNGVLMSGNKYSGVISSDFRSIGDTAVRILGFDDNSAMWESEELYTLSPTRNFVQNSHISDCGYSGIYVTNGIGDIMSHNTVSNMNEAGIVLSNSVECIVEYNEIADFGTNVWDCGAVYCSGIPLSRGNHIRYNYIHDTAAGGVGVYFDGMTSGNMAYGNILLNVKNDFSINGGRETAIVNNITAVDGDAIHTDGTGVFVSEEDYLGTSSHNDSFFKPKFISEDGDIQSFMNSRAYESDILKVRYPEMYTWLGYVQDMLDAMTSEGDAYERGALYDTSDPENLTRAPYDIYIARNAFDKDISYSTSILNVTDYVWPLKGTDTNYMYDSIDDIGFTDVAQKDFSIADNSGIYDRITDFDNIPFNKTGTVYITRLEAPGVYASEYYKLDANSEKSMLTIIKWSKVAGAHSYKVEVSEDENFSNILCQETTFDTEYRLSKQLSNDFYYVRITAQSTSRTYSREATGALRFLAAEPAGEQIAVVYAKKTADGYIVELLNNTSSSVTADVYVASAADNTLLGCTVARGAVIEAGSSLKKEFKAEGDVTLYVWNSSLTPLRKALKLN